ncbi:MAG TPA: NAD(P)/FAD-dependent oxidoreductase [Burkholderiales bacterium]|nr:NAD(P)/FAD-dependent oxidoreductase [Burkholderiales bacterium]
MSRPRDVLIIGAGLSGMYALHRLRALGFDAHVYEAGSDVGGTWYWNRYPGARFDSESWTYGFSFSEELLRDWNWSEHFSPQPETLRYCNFVADRLDLRRDMSFGFRVAAARWDDAAGEWEIAASDGRRERARFLVTAIGALSAPVMPRIPGTETFGGEAHHTGLWPHEPVSFAGKRVGIVGTGASAVQAIPEIAKSAARLTVFQRSPNWCAPLGNGPIDEPTQRRIHATYEEIFARCRDSYGCFVHDADPRNAVEVSAEEREALYEKTYAMPGFAKWMGNFRDILIDPAANDTISDFMRRKIRSRLKDPALAEKLVPRNHGYGTRRVPLETGYYETFNRPNVRLVDLREAPIERVTPAGIVAGGEEHALDMIVYATGFDAITGGFDRIDFRGREGKALKDKWAGGPRTYLGMQVAGFPNLFMLIGPHSAALFCNMTRCIEQQVEFVSALLEHVRDRGLARVEADPRAEEDWTAHVHDTAARMLFTQVDSWMTGVHSEIRRARGRMAMVYAGGAPKFRKRCEEVAAAGYAGFRLG